MQPWLQRSENGYSDMQHLLQMQHWLQMKHLLQIMGVGEGGQGGDRPPPLS